MATAASATLPRIKGKVLRRRSRTTTKAAPKATNGAGFGQRFSAIVRRLWARRGNRSGVDDAILELTLDMIEPTDIDPTRTEADHTLLQWLWGPGHLVPCALEILPDAIKALGLTKGSTLLELEPGLGGASRTIARETGATIKAYALDGPLAERAAELAAQTSHAAALAFDTLDPSSPAFGEAAFDHAIASHGLTDVPSLEPVFKAVHGALKPKGKFIVAQIVGDPATAKDASLVAIGASRAAPVGLVTADTLKDALTKAGFKVASPQSCKAAFRARLAQTWAHLAERLRRDDVDARYGAMILAECTHWVRIDALLAQGTLDLVVVTAERD
jgi:cyclopropane fatty-acyl-phospholipid synthase-like methyltransferase